MVTPPLGEMRTFCFVMQGAKSWPCRLVKYMRCPVFFFKKRSCPLRNAKRELWVFSGTRVRVTKAEAIPR